MTMENITITIETGNSAFDDEPATEVARILLKLAGEFQLFGHSQFSKLYDLNGNPCGRVIVTQGDGSLS
jgi:hypothetical protein